MKEELNGFTKICKIGELKDRQGKRFYVGDTEVAVFKVDEKIYALNNICPHQHSAIIYDGFIEDQKVMCPAHGWEFDLATGQMAKGRKGLDVYDVKIENDDIYVKVIEKELKW